MSQTSALYNGLWLLGRRKCRNWPVWVKLWWWKRVEVERFKETLAFYIYIFCCFCKNASVSMSVCVCIFIICEEMMRKTFLLLFLLLLLLLLLQNCFKQIRLKKVDSIFIFVDSNKVTTKSAIIFSLRSF